MVWKQYKKYLEEEILLKKGEKETNENEEENEEEEEEAINNDEDNEEAENSVYSFRSDIASQYNIKNSPEVTKALTDLIISIDKNSNHSFGSSSDNKGHHDLPLLSDRNLIDEESNPITWQKLFPEREQVFFGKQENDLTMNEETYNALAQIFNDFTLKSTRKDRLKTMAGENGGLKDFTFDALVSLNYELIKRKGYDKKVQGWLDEYDKLDEYSQDELKEQKKLVDTIMNAIQEETQARRKQKIWKNVFWYGGIGLLVILLLLVIRKLFKMKN